MEEEEERWRAEHEAKEAEALKAGRAETVQLLKNAVEKARELAAD